MEDVEGSVREKILGEYDEMMNEDRERDRGESERETMTDRMNLRP